MPDKKETQFETQSSKQNQATEKARIAMEKRYKKERHQREDFEVKLENKTVECHRLTQKVTTSAAREITLLQEIKELKENQQAEIKRVVRESNAGALRHTWEVEQRQNDKALERKIRLEYAEQLASLEILTKDKADQRKLIDKQINDINDLLDGKAKLKKQLYEANNRIRDLESTVFATKTKLLQQHSFGRHYKTLIKFLIVKVYVRIKKESKRNLIQQEENRKLIRTLHSYEAEDQALSSKTPRSHQKENSMMTQNEIDTWLEQDNKLMSIYGKKKGNRLNDQEGFQRIDEIWHHFDECPGLKLY